MMIVEFKGLKDISLSQIDMLSNVTPIGYARHSHNKGDSSNPKYLYI